MKVAARWQVILLMATLLSVPGWRWAQAANTPGVADREVEQALGVFLTAFDNLDWVAFRECFAPDASMFHPAAPNLKRIDSPQEFEQAWLGVFARIKKTSGRNVPPYMNLHPQDVKIQLLSQDIALVTFHLVDGNMLNRRTIVFRRDAGRLKIIHIHASNLVLPVP